jgi:hypothetical protein
LYGIRLGNFNSYVKEPRTSVKISLKCVTVQLLVFPNVPVCRMDEEQNPSLTSISSFPVTDNKSAVNVINIKKPEMGLICSMHGDIIM